MELVDRDFDFVRAFICEQAGIVLEHGKEYLVESRLAPIVRRANLPDIAAIVDRLRRHDPELRRAVIEALTTNETTFFRDVMPFETIRNVVIPALIEARKHKRELRFWYGASSTGQEPYSVVMLLADHFPQLEDWTVTHVATDLNLDVLERARAGRYSQIEINRGLPAPCLVKHFERHGTEWQLKEHLRRRVKFEQLNLVKPWPAMGPFDVIMMRNVMIYFDADAKKSILTRASRLMGEDGYLFLGAAETTIGTGTSFERMPYERSGCYRPAAAAAAVSPLRGVA